MLPCDLPPPTLSVQDNIMCLKHFQSGMCQTSSWELTNTFKINNVLANVLFWPLNRVLLHCITIYNTTLFISFWVDQATQISHVEKRLKGVRSKTVTIHDTNWYLLPNVDGWQHHHMTSLSITPMYEITEKLFTSTTTRWSKENHINPGTYRSTLIH
jgi:hypothetical protein